MGLSGLSSTAAALDEDAEDDELLAASLTAALADADEADAPAPPAAAAFGTFTPGTHGWYSSGMLPLIFP